MTQVMERTRSRIRVAESHLLDGLVTAAMGLGKLSAAFDRLQQPNLPFKLPIVHRKLR